jgi:hypothetical protein
VCLLVQILPIGVIAKRKREVIVNTSVIRIKSFHLNITGALNMSDTESEVAACKSEVEVDSDPVYVQHASSADVVDSSEACESEVDSDPGHASAAAYVVDTRQHPESSVAVGDAQSLPAAHMQTLDLHLARRLSLQPAPNFTKRYISFGLGSAGDHVLGSKKQKKLKKADGSFLSTHDDLEEMKAFAAKCNEYGGYFNAEGNLGFDKATALKKISALVPYCNKKESTLILYYTGHGAERTGNWCFVDGEISYSEVCASLREIQFGAYIISDCCFSGAWIHEATLQFPVIAASSSSEVAYDGVFAKAFWGKGLIQDAISSSHPCKSFSTDYSLQEALSFEDFSSKWFVNGDLDPLTSSPTFFVC